LRVRTALGLNVDSNDGTIPEAVKWASMASICSAELVDCAVTKGRSAREAIIGKEIMITKLGKERAWAVLNRVLENWNFVR